MFSHLVQSILRLVLLILLLTVGALHAQPIPDSTVTIVSVGGEYVNKEAWGGRLFTSIGGEYIQVSPFSWSFVRDPASRAVRLSVNPIFAAPLLVALTGEFDLSLPLVLLPLLPQLLTNLSFQFPVVHEHLYLAAGQRTDFYLLNDVARIYTEGYVGARLLGGRDIPIGLDMRYVWPISQGFLENKRPYLGIGLSFTLVRVKPGHVSLDVAW